MKLTIPASLTHRIKSELRKAGRREIGGVLVGEHVQGDQFRLVDFSVQKSGGSIVHFVRDVASNKAFLDAFFARTGNDFSKCNYIGEWHSHPSFSAQPSGTDLRTMQSIVEDPQVGVYFAVLLIFSLRFWTDMEMSATAFRPHATAELVEVQIESDILSEGIVHRILKAIWG